jgi:hypothetical protein
MTHTFGVMNRIGAHILQKTGFLVVFIELSYVCARSVTVYSDVRPRTSPIELGIAFVTLLLVLQYGAFLRGEITIRRMRWRWLIGALFFGTLFFLTPPSFLDDVNWNVVCHAFSWPVQWDYVLEGIGEFFPYVAVYWMPMAGLISLVAFIASFAPSDDANEEPAEQSASDRDKPPV